MLSRVADSLYWMSRYLERAEHTARLLDLQLHLMLELPASTLDRSWMRLLNSLQLDPPSEGIDAYRLTRLLTFDPRNPDSVVACISAARENARHVREQISSEMWEQVNRASLQLRAVDIDDIWNDRPHEFLLGIKEGCHLFQGITDSTMSHGEGWQFIQIGRAVERAMSVARLIKSHYDDYENLDYRARVTEDFIEWVGLLKSCTAFEAYCKVYTADLRPNRIAEYLILNPDFPHSIRFTLISLSAALQAVSQMTESKRAKSVNRLSGRLRASLDYGQIDEIMAKGLSPFLDDIILQVERLHQAIYEAYIWYPIDEMVS